MVNPQLIRQALIDLANNKQRDHFPCHIVKEVLQAFACGAFHHLKQDVLSILGWNAKEYVARYADLKDLCKNDIMIRRLSEASGVEYKMIKSILDGKIEIDNNTWVRLASKFDEVDR